MNSRLSFAIALGLCLGAMPLCAQAQKVSFSFGHYHGHHHHHCWDDPWYWGPRYEYIYVAPPPPVVRREIRYVQPVERVIETREIAPPREVTAPANDTFTSRAAAQTPLQIWNSGGQKVPVAFLVDGQEVTLHDGQSHTSYGSGAKLVEFDRGGNFGTGRRSLSGSRYEFVITDRGWDLVRQGDAKPTTTATAPRNELPGVTRR
jgi:hypothetical protein